MSAGVISPKLILSGAGPTRVNPREVKPLVSGVKPAGDSTPARPDTAARLGFGPPSTKSTAETRYGLLVNSRIEWWWRLGLGRPELSPVSTLAVAGARVLTVLVLRGTAGRTAGCYGLLVMC